MRFTASRHHVHAHRRVSASPRHTSASRDIQTRVTTHSCHDMTTSVGDKAALRFYPERYHHLSPTFKAWVKLTAAGVHALRAAPSSADGRAADSNFLPTTGPAPTHPTFYYLNHPIRFVRLVGTVVALEDLGPRFALLTLDDGSGATVEVKITRLLPTQLDATGTHASNTTVANVSVDAGVGVFGVRVDGAAVRVGATVKAKCTLATFRGTTQLCLQRCALVAGGAVEEARAWRETAAFVREVLGRPWALSEERMREADEEARRAERRRGEEERRAERKKREREGRKAEWWRERAEKVKAYEEKVEARRKREEVLMNKGALV